MLKEDLIKKNPLRVLSPLELESLPDHRENRHPRPDCNGQPAARQQGAACQCR
jgi:hypothetical protein